MFSLDIIRVFLQVEVLLVLLPVVSYVVRFYSSSTGTLKQNRGTVRLSTIINTISGTR
jgi:hypothetical protein